MRVPPIAANASNMTYLMISKSPVGTMAGFNQVLAALEVTEPDGLLARYAGEDDGLAIVTVWESKVQADRFEAEHLLPTIRRVLGEIPGPPPMFIAFEPQDEFVLTS